MKNRSFVAAIILALIIFIFTINVFAVEKSSKSKIELKTDQESKISGTEKESPAVTDEPTPPPPFPPPKPPK